METNFASSATVKRFSYLMETVPVLFSKMSNDDFEQPVAADKWTKKQVLGHLIDSAANNHQRFVRTQYEKVPFIVYDPDQWNALNGYHSLSPSAVTELWTVYNRHLLHLMKTTSQENLSKKCNSGGTELVTLQWLMEDYVVHMEHHLKQITTY